VMGGVVHSRSNVVCVGSRTKEKLCVDSRTLIVYFIEVSQH
jgi:hypothetical protein